jgi:peptidoglycan hydrolase-like protein with peptidoglycan-binding domain
VVVAMGLVAAFAAVAAGTWWIAVSVRSPAQREAAASPPPAQAVLATVTRGDLEDQTTAKAVVTRADTRSYEFYLAGGRSVVTAAPLADGGQLRNGDVVLRVNSRPLFVFEGSFPAWRDIGEGDSGEDVAQLQAALGELGYEVPADGEFGPLTRQAVLALYAAAGSLAGTRAAESAAAAGEPAGGDSVEPPATLAQVVFPATELLFVASLPAVVVGTPGVGAVLTAETARVAVGGEALSLKAEVPDSVATAAAQTGQAWALAGTVRIDLQVSAGTAGPSADGAGQPEGASEAVGATLTLSLPPGVDPPESWHDGAEVIVSMDLSEPVVDALLVPKAAISADSAGQGRVVVHEADGQSRVVDVNEVKCVAGLCAIEPVAPNELSEGARVRVGFA